MKDSMSKFFFLEWLAIRSSEFSVTGSIQVETRQPLGSSIGAWLWGKVEGENIAAENELNGLLEFLEPKQPRILDADFVLDVGFHFFFLVILKITPLPPLQIFKYGSIDDGVKALLRKISLLCGVILIEGIS